MIKDNKGITLVSLVITIIILLILSGILLIQLEQNDIFEKTKLAKEESENAQKTEQNYLEEYENNINAITNEGSNDDKVDDKNMVMLLKGEDFLDSSPQKNNNIINNNVTISEDGKNGKSFYFNGKSYFTIYNTSLVDGSKDFTVDLWAKFLENPSSYSTLFRIGGNNTGSAMCTVGLYILNDNIILMTNGGGRGWDYTSTSTTFEKNVWMHLAVVKNGNEMYLYKNGQKVGTRTFSSELTTTQLNYFGKDCDIGNQYFKGYLDEIRISNIARWTEDSFDINELK